MSIQLCYLWFSILVLLFCLVFYFNYCFCYCFSWISTSSTIWCYIFFLAFVIVLHTYIYCTFSWIMGGKLPFCAVLGALSYTVLWDLLLFCFCMQNILIYVCFCYGLDKSIIYIVKSRSSLQIINNFGIGLFSFCQIRHLGVVCLIFYKSLFNICLYNFTCTDHNPHM